MQPQTPTKQHDGLLRAIENLESSIADKDMSPSKLSPGGRIRMKAEALNTLRKAVCELDGLDLG